MVTREPKESWVSAKISASDRAALERLAALCEGSISQALRVAIRKADPARSPKSTRQAAGGVG